MFFLLKRYASMLLFVVLFGWLAGCATTETGSEAVIEDLSVDEAVAQEDSELFISETETPAGSTVGEEPVESGLDGATTAPVEQTATVEPAAEYPIQGDELESIDEVATTAPVQQDGAVDVIEEFPIQRYEIDEPTAISQEEAEIERLRQELAASESELARIRAEEEQRDYPSSDALTSAETSGEAIGSEAAPAPAQQTTAGRAPDQPAPRRGASEVSGAPAENSIYFSYDQATLDEQYESVVVAHAEFLKANPDLSVEIQGNCDERGSREYNIALGQRRALAVKRALELLGVQGDRIVTVSFGSEKPVAFGHDEDSWRLNRRADIVY